MLKKYFLTRKGWEIEKERLLKKQSAELQNQWEEILSHRLEREKESIKIEKNSEIKILKDELVDKKNEIKYLRESDLENEKLKNDLKAKIEHLDYQNKLLSEVQTRIAIQLGMSDSLIRDSEKLLKRETTT